MESFQVVIILIQGDKVRWINVVFNFIQTFPLMMDTVGIEPCMKISDDFLMSKSFPKGCRNEIMRCNKQQLAEHYTIGQTFFFKLVKL